MEDLWYILFVRGGWMEFLIRVAILIIVVSGIVTLLIEIVEGIITNRKCETCDKKCPYYEDCEARFSNDRD